MSAPHPILIRLLPVSRLKSFFTIVTNTSQNRPHYEISIPGQPVEKTHDPDLRLKHAGLSIFEASALIYQTDLYSRGTWISSVGDRIITPIDVSSVVDEPVSGCRVRVACGRNVRSNRATTFIIEYLDSSGQAHEVRTTNPIEVLATVTDVDPFRAERLCVNAVWRWDNAIFGWSS